MKLRDGLDVLRELAPSQLAAVISTASPARGAGAAVAMGGHCLPALWFGSRRAQAGVVGAVQPSFQRKLGGGGGPGGWWIATEVEILLETGDVVRPDIVGWRRERSPDRPTGMPVTLRPDWICEVISPSNASNDMIDKLRLDHRVGISYYWIADPRDATLTVLRWSADGYVTRLRAARNEVVRAEPFEAVELAVGRLFGDDPVEG